MNTAILLIIGFLTGTIFGSLIGYYIREHENRVKTKKWAISRLKLKNLDK